MVDNFLDLKAEIGLTSMAFLCATYGRRSIELDVLLKEIGVSDPKELTVIVGRLARLGLLCAHSNGNHSKEIGDYSKTFCIFSNSRVDKDCKVVLPIKRATYVDMYVEGLDERPFSSTAGKVLDNYEDVVVSICFTVLGATFMERYGGRY